MQEKLDEIIENYTDKMVDGLEVIGDAISGAWEFVWDILEMLILIPVVTVLVIVTFPFYCLGRMLSK